MLEPLAGRTGAPPRTAEWSDDRPAISTKRSAPEIRGDARVGAFLQENQLGERQCRPDVAGGGLA